MTGMDGLELAAQIYERHPKCVIIIISAYWPYEYMRRAVQNRVFDYIIKPISDIELNDVLRRCIAQLRDEMAGRTGQADIDPIESVNKQRVESVLLDMLKGNIHTDLFASTRGKLGVPWLADGYMCAYMRQRDAYNDLRRERQAAIEATTRFMSGRRRSHRIIRIAGNDDFCALVGKKEAETDVHMQSNVRDAMNALLAEHESGYTCGMSLVFSQVASLEDSYRQARQMSLMCPEAPNMAQQFKPQQTTRFVSEMIDYLEQNYAHPLTLDILAEHFMMNYSYLSRAFKKVCHFSVVEYINMLRIRKAKELLREKLLGVNEIAETVGFENVNYFYKVFKALEKNTPQKYRESTVHSVREDI